MIRRPPVLQGKVMTGVSSVGDAFSAEGDWNEGCVACQELSPSRVCWSSSKLNVGHREKGKGCVLLFGKTLGLVTQSGLVDIFTLLS